jgi:uncharacterized protein (TIGR03790 family)
LAGSVFAELTADQLLLIYNANSDVSRSLAEHYARVRGVPANRLLGVQVPISEEISQYAYKTQIADVVRAHLQNAQLSGQVRCLVCFYEVPIRVQRFSPGRAEMKTRTRLLKRADAACQALNSLTDQLNQLGDPATQPVSRPATRRAQTEQALGDYFRARLAGQRRLSRPSSHPQVMQDQQAFMHIVRQAEGRGRVRVRDPHEGYRNATAFRPARDGG